MTRSGHNRWNRVAGSTAAFALLTLLAWTTAAFLFVLLRRAPSTRGASPITQPAFLASLLPWLAGSVYWVKLRKRAKLGKTDEDTACLCYGAIYVPICAAYVAMQLIAILLFQVVGGAR